MCRLTNPYRSIVRNVRDRFETFRPVRSASSCNDPGCVSTIVASNARFRCDRTRAKLSVDGNQTFGSSALGTTDREAVEDYLGTKYAITITH